ncbi:MAG: GNAT family N-acetyltransferase [Candidatus Thermoplasmatota archaeon]|nr:GNAT family N-acetyltransferase [Candidatus Thermoplasmatota archaeon]
MRIPTDHSGNSDGTVVGLKGSGFVLREADFSDMAGLERIENICFPYGRYSGAILRAFLMNPFSRTYVIEQDGIVASEIIIIHRRSVEIASIAVLPEARGRGIAKALLGKAEQIATKKRISTLTLHVAVDNTPAIKLYEKEGYRACEVISEYYGSGLSALYMKKELNIQ